MAELDKAQKGKGKFLPTENAPLQAAAFLGHNVCKIIVAIIGKLIGNLDVFRGGKSRVKWEH